MGYEKRLILFLDILGFEEFIRINKDNIEPVLEIHKTISKIFALNEEHWESCYSKKMAQFSDCLVTSYNLNEDPDAVVLMIESVQEIHIKLMIQNILVRGAICIGDLYHDYFELKNEKISKSSIIFGEGINNAYYIESKLSIYPRTIVHEDVIPHVKNSELSELLVKDFDGFYYVDYINSQKWIAKNKNLKNKFKLSLENKIKMGMSENDRIKQKYKWLNEKLCSSLILNQ